uniref:Polycomb group RING finger protein 3 isoform X5 n=2 Tax=Tursiops truncatus TaxID=9739 RepID=A0A6J3RCP2_TURTR|nr:polycomb group RING finger protein 3 isoform X5 [Tursiops truncatus]
MYWLIRVFFLQKPKMLTRKIKLWDINAHITCRLCSGYLIDATTVTECLHTFCRSCLVKYLEENNTCPTCRIVIHQSHPLQYIGHDRTMQDIVYKLVPGLQEGEHLSGMQQQQTAGPETEVDPLLSPGHSPAPKEVHCQKTQPLVFQRAGHFMQRGDPGQGPHAQIRRRHEVEIQESTAPAALQTQDGPAVSRGTAETQPPGAPRVRSQAGPPPRRMLPWAPFGLGPEQRIFITFV